MLKSGWQAVLLIVVVATVAAGCTQPAGTAADRETMYQVSTYSALAQGNFGGVMPVGTMERHGDFGLGTYDGLDGEMVYLDGIMYQVKSDGTVAIAKDSATTPFATVTFFDTDMAEPVENVRGLNNLTALIDRIIPTNSTMYAVELHGNFSAVKARSVPVQARPYPALAEVVKQQSVFERENVSGTLVAVRFPASMEGVNLPGYHYHFISDDRRFGGHVLDCSVENGTLAIDGMSQFTMVLPDSVQESGAAGPKSAATGH